MLVIHAIGSIPSSSGHAKLRTDSVNCRESAGHRVSTCLKVVPVTDATFEGHHGSINVQLSFPNCLKKSQNAPRPSLFPNVVSCTFSDMPHVREYSSQLCFISTRSLRFQKLASHGRRCCSKYSSSMITLVEAGYKLQLLSTNG